MKSLKHFLLSVLPALGYSLLLLKPQRNCVGRSSFGILAVQEGREPDIYGEDLGEIDRAHSEELLMNKFQKIKFEEVKGIDTEKLVREIEEKGVARIDDLLTLEKSKSLLSLINEQLLLSTAQVFDLNMKNDHFSNSKAQENRWDLKLPFCKTIEETLLTVLGEGTILGDALHDLVGNQGVITELASFVTISGAGRQIIHSDTFWSKHGHSYTCTIALQDVDEQMGPTVFIPTTHTEESFLIRATEYMTAEDSDEHSSLLTLPHMLSDLNAGSGALYDSRLLHCGGANRSPRPRVLFYFTVATATKEGVDDTIDDFDSILEGADDEIDTSGNTKSIRAENVGFVLGDFRQGCKVHGGTSTNVA